MSPLRIIFFGTPEFAVPTLRELLAAGHDVAAVVTQPDRPRGRGQKPSPGPVKAFADEHGLRVLQPDRLRDEGFLALLAALAPDLGVVAAYGKILPAAVLASPRLGLINVHASLLPQMARRVADPPGRDGRRRRDRRVDHAGRAGARRRRRLRPGAAPRSARTRPAKTSSAISRSSAPGSPCPSSTRSRRARRPRRRRTRRSSPTPRG